MPTTLFVSVNATINAFRMVDHVFVMTQGGPNNASIAAALLHLRPGLPLLGHGLCGHADRGDGGDPGHHRHRPVLPSRPAGALQMTTRGDRQGKPIHSRRGPRDPPRPRAVRDRRLGAGADLAAAARLCDLDGDPPAGLRDALRALRAADARQFRARLERGPFRALFPQHDHARHHGADGAAGAVHAGGLCLRAAGVSGQERAVRAGAAAADGDAGHPAGAQLRDHERSSAWSTRSWRSACPISPPASRSSSCARPSRRCRRNWTRPRASRAAACSG
jgi:hypothetical protein